MASAKLIRRVIWIASTALLVGACGTDSRVSSNDATVNPAAVSSTWRSPVQSSASEAGVSRCPSAKELSPHVDNSDVDMDSSTAVETSPSAKPTPNNVAHDVAQLGLQERLDFRATQLRAFVKQRGYRGLSEVSIDLARQRVEVWWFGKIPRDLATFVGDDVSPTTVFKTAVMGRDEQDAIADELWNRFGGQCRESGAEWYITGTTASLSGETLGVSVERSPDAPSLEAIKSQMQQEAGALRLSVDENGPVPAIVMPSPNR